MERGRERRVGINTWDFNMFEIMSKEEFLESPNNLIVGDFQKEY